MNHIIVEGFIGSGKGAVARAVGKKLKLTVVDVDRKVSERMKMSVAEIYERFGEPYYRAMETIVLGDLAQTQKEQVIVLGSGVAMMPQNRKYLKELGTVYYIKLKQQTIIENMKNSKKHEWIRSDGWDEQVSKLYKEREPAYSKTADVVIKADGKSVEEIADEIVRGHLKTGPDAE